MKYADRVDRLRREMTGRLILPEDDGYDDSRRLWNGMVDRRPALIAQCSGTPDVVAAVDFGRENDLVVAVRGGGHNVSGNASCDGGIVIDLRAMKGIRVDPGGRTAAAEGGVTWGEYDAATQRHGLASPGGAISTTGVAGLTLGGGFGWLSRSYGLACDNLMSAEVVTADGEVRTASERENPDLLWGLRGGGGNFGVVTRFEFRLHPVGELHAGLILHPRREAASFLRMFAEVTAAAPDAMSSMAAFLSTPDGDPVVGVFVVYHGAAEEAERALSPIRSFGSPLLDDVGPKPYTVVQRAFDEGFPSGLRNYWKSSYLAGLGEDCIRVLVDHADRAPSPLSIVGLEHMLGGAVARVGPEDTAFGSRDADYNLLVLGMADDPGLDDAVKQWAREMWTAVEPYSTGSVYVNYMDADESERVAEAYGERNLARLVELKDRFDPGNLFHLNQNISPSG
jgi:FAD/FMN-containing dehydrogenase